MCTQAGILGTGCGRGAVDVTGVDREWGRVVPWRKIRCYFYTKEEED